MQSIGTYTNTGSYRRLAFICPGEHMMTMVTMDGCLMRLAASFNTYAESHMLVAARFARWKESERGM